MNKNNKCGQVNILLSSEGVNSPVVVSLAVTQVRVTSAGVKLNVTV